MAADFVIVVVAFDGNGVFSVVHHDHPQVASELFDGHVTCVAIASFVLALLHKHWNMFSILNFTVR